jgi:hypothetical protein
MQVLPPWQEQLVRLLGLVLVQLAQKQTERHIWGSLLGICRYLKWMLCEVKAQGITPATLDATVTVQALLAYFEDVLLAKGRNDPCCLGF